MIDEKWGADNGFGVGDEFTAKTSSGEEITYTVTGTFKDNTDYIGDYAASDVNADAYGEGRNASSILVNIADGSAPEAVRAEIDSLVEERFPTVETQNQQELKDAIGEQLNTLLGVVYALLLLAVIVSLFGIVNTLALSIHERTRELGLLRAVGTSRRQVRRMVRYEAVITALIGAVLGLVLGVVFAVGGQPPPGRRGLHADDPDRNPAGAAGAGGDRRHHRRDRPGAAGIPARRARGARLRIVPSRRHVRRLLHHRSHVRGPYLLLRVPRGDRAR